MFLKPELLFLKFELLFLLPSFAVSEIPFGFLYNGFKDANLARDGLAEITTNGLLRLTNETKQEQGHAFYPHPFQLKKSSNGNTTTTNSFSTTFVFAIVSEYADVGGHGIAFVVSKTKSLYSALPSQYLGLFNMENNGNSSNQIVAVELDTIYSSEFDDINDNHVGIDINGLRSIESAPAMCILNGYGDYKNLQLISGLPMQVWVEYDGLEQLLNVTLAPTNIRKPEFPLLSLSYDLSPIISDYMYVGFSSSTGSVFTSHYILGWSFMLNGEAQPLSPHHPQLPVNKIPNKSSKVLMIGFPILVLACMLVMISYGRSFMIRRKKKFEELLDDWELCYVPHRFSYKDLYVASKGFREKELLGIGGFGRVYKGVLPISKIEVAVKRVSHESRQGIREFIAEIVSLGQLRHRNLVQLLGYCRRKGELLLVYDFMPNGSLDKYLFHSTTPTLNWYQRFRIIKGVALGLVYLHEECEQVVIHRDIKASNILLDAQMDGRLGDFGLARLYDHGTTNPQTTHVVGTIGYLAPEMSRTGKATTSTDVFAFGAFLLEVACGRRPIERQESNENIVLVDWVFSCWNQGGILQVTDPQIGTDYTAEEMELVLKLGLICSHRVPSLRPNMRQVVQILDGTLPLPELSVGLYSHTESLHGESFDDFISVYSSPMAKAFTGSLSVVESLLFSGR